MLRDGRRYEGAWNFGPAGQGDDRPVRWVVDRFLSEWGSGSWSTPADAGQDPHEAHRLRLDSTKAREQLGFPLSGWICAEDVRTYKPNVEFWEAVSERRGVAFGRRGASGAPIAIG